MNFSKLFGALALSSFAIVAGCTAETAPTESTASEHADLKSCTGLGQAQCEETTGCMEKDTSCVVSCTVNGGCVNKCATACAPLDCSALANGDCTSYSGNQCQLEKSCVVSCHAGANGGCTTTCSDSCVPTTVNCAQLNQTACAANGNLCTSVPGACVVSCTVNGGCVEKCAPATCAPISN